MSGLKVGDTVVATLNGVVESAPSGGIVKIKLDRGGVVVDAYEYTVKKFTVPGLAAPAYTPQQAADVKAANAARLKEVYGDSGSDSEGGRRKTRKGKKRVTRKKRSTRRR